MVILFSMNLLELCYKWLRYSLSVTDSEISGHGRISEHVRLNSSETEICSHRRNPSLVSVSD